MDAITNSKSLIPGDELTQIAGQPALKISRHDLMEPFLMTLVSDSDLWMYVSSLGSLTAGRIDEDHSLFPYCAEDVIHRSAGRTGPSTTFKIKRPDGSFEVWEPFAQQPAPVGISRNLYKSVLGNFIVFEEVHEALDLTFRYRWSSSDRFGFVRTATLVNGGLNAVHVDLLDGLLNMLPAGVSYWMLQNMSSLPDAYTQCEVDPSTGLTTLAMASLIVDKAEPAESLLGSVAWSRGLDSATVLLSHDQHAAFVQGSTPHSESFMRGRRGNFLVSASLELVPGEQTSWDIVVDCYRTQGEVEGLRAFLLSGQDARLVLHQSVHESADRLSKFVASADGQQISNDRAATMHHEACVLFNIMRGGIYSDGDHIHASDFRTFVATRNASVSQSHTDWLSGLPALQPYSQLLESARSQGDPNLLRLTYEYLPLTFSRRHGDPSRPWNRFAIRLKNPDGTPLLAYQGNWRDIFQNWEALSLSYPMFLEGIIAKFVNASTLDGYNPYRIMREGIEWEVPNPNDQWAAMGYWGDHQIIYLLKFLEQAEQIRPQQLRSLLKEEVFSYANVPLRIRSYEEIVRDPHTTIDFDFEKHEEIERAVTVEGTDAKLLRGDDGSVYLVSLAEKLIVPALSKLSNLVVDAGIWMNTQRPEWNDANNALVGNGVSMVTLCYLRRYLTFCKALFDSLDGDVPVSFEVVEWLGAVQAALSKRSEMLSSPSVSDEDRRALLDEVGTAFSEYRAKVYASGFSGKVTLPRAEISRLCETAIPFLDHSISANRRSDGLYHAYNILDMREPGKAKLARLQEMLEGQVAILSAGVLSPKEVSGLVQSLFASKLYRPDQDTFILYPDRQLPGFLEKNRIPEDRVLANPLLKALLNENDARILSRDVAGRLRFAAEFHNASALSNALDRLSNEQKWSSLVSEHRADVLDVYEAVFNHRFFTGRSGGMYAYEGLGSIYWHMVSKLMVAVQESFYRAEKAGASARDLEEIAGGYYRIRKGMGFNKTSREFGAFPSDPYSHTPSGRGAKQPGMTGQSKEDILARWMELGIFPENGTIRFHPAMLRETEFISVPTSWKIRDLHGDLETLELPGHSLGFTVCGAPIVYVLGGRTGVEVLWTDGHHDSSESSELTGAQSEAIFARSGLIKRITVSLTKADLLA